MNFECKPKRENRFISRVEKQKPVGERVKSIVLSLLEEHFPNGIRPYSVIDINKLKRYYRKAGEIIPPDMDISSLLQAIGIWHSEKIFAISHNSEKGLIGLLERLIAEGNRLFYYDEFYDAHSDFLREARIFSSDLLKTMLSHVFPLLRYSKNYFSTESNVTVESEVSRCYKSAIYLSYEQLKAKLPYVPLEKIKQALAQNNDFLWVYPGIYIHTKKMEFDESERYATEAKVETEIVEHGYASLALLDVPNSLELNPELSKTAVKNGLFQLFLADRYEKRGNIITPKGKPLNSVAIFEHYCLTHDHLTLDELSALEKDINGSVHSQALLVAYDVMVRVDKDDFVADAEIDFDVETTDNALGLFIHTDVIPLRTVTSFTSFPYIEGYRWNLFLLESYCRRFSQQFQYQCLVINSRNVGAIFRESARFADYTDVLAFAAANADVELREKEVGDFLFDSGYVAARTANTIAKVTAKARIIRERRV
ncbi:MAG: hypothetical protein LBJ36_10450 [Synergistaceae bacterium]|jgi:hypothetical protein|nr:hypothetical protein [Synergistaceae bacterium]